MVVSDLTFISSNGVSTSSTVFATTNISNPRGLAFESNNNLYKGNTGDNKIAKVNSNGQPYHD